MKLLFLFMAFLRILQTHGFILSIFRGHHHQSESSLPPRQSSTTIRSSSKRDLQLEDAINKAKACADKGLSPGAGLDTADEQSGGVVLRSRTILK
jgi:hypothetical protein